MYIINCSNSLLRSRVLRLLLRLLRRLLLCVLSLEPDVQRGAGLVDIW